MKLLLILAIAGLACGLQPSLKYTYKYFGEARTGIPEINNEGAAVAMKANVVLEVDQRGHAIVTIQEPVFAEINGDLGCGFREEVPYQFAPLKDSAVQAKLQKPFEANLYGDEPIALTLQEDELVWMTNVRKGILTSLRNELVKGNFDSVLESPVLPLILVQNQVREVIEVQEETIHGLCDVQYTAHEIPQVIADQYVPELSTAYIPSAQSQSNYNQEASEQLWHVVKSVIFERCLQSVQLQRSSGGVQGTMGPGQYEYLGGRSSTTEYVMRGTPGSLQIERVSVDGTVNVNALGMTKEHLQTISNQTLILERVEPNQRPTTLRAAKKQSPTWMQEVISSVNEPKVSPKLPWVVYTGNASIIDSVEILNGIPQNPTEFPERQQRIQENLEFAAQAMIEESPSSKMQSGEIIERIKEAASLMEALPKENIKQIIEEILPSEKKSPNEQLKKKLLIDIITASGTKPAVQMLIELAQENRISEIDVLAICVTLLQTLQDVTIIPELMNFVMDIDMKEKPFLAATALVNFARISQRLCMDPNATTVNYAGQLFGDEVCDKELFTGQFVPYLEEIINDESLGFQRVVGLQTLHKLGLPTSLEIIAPIALGAKGSSTLLRVAAVNTLDRWCQPQETRSEVMELLTQLYTNIAEQPRVRAAAVTVLATWSPEINFFSRIARMSWREPSPAMVATYWSLIRSYASVQHPLFVKQAQAASSAIKLVKPVAPNVNYPWIMQEVRNMVNQQVLRVQESIVATYEYPQRLVNFDVTLYLMNSINGYDMELVEALILGGSQDRLRETAPTNYESNGVHSKAANRFYEMIQETVQALPKHHIELKDQVSVVYLRLVENMQVLAPFSIKTMKTLVSSGKIRLPKILKKLEKGQSAVLGKFFVPVVTKQFYPNEMGLPIVIQHSTAVAFSQYIKGKLAVTPRPKSIWERIPERIEAQATQYFKLLSQSSGEIEVQVPWANSAIKSAVKSSRDVTLPVDLSVDVNVQALISHQGPPSYFEVVVSPAYESKFPVLAARNVPYTVIEQLSLSGRPRQPVVNEIVSHEPFVKHVEVPSVYTGIQLNVNWKSELRYPFDVVGLLSVLKNPKDLYVSPKLYYLMASTTARMWEINVELDPQQSPTKQVAFVSSCILPTLTRGAPSYEPVSLSPQQQLAQQQQAQLNNAQRSSLYPSTPSQQPFPRPELPNLLLGASQANSCNASISFMGDEVRHYEMVYSWTEPTYESQRKQVKAQIAFTRSAIPEVDSESISVCLDYKKESPIISELDTVGSILAKNLDNQYSKKIVVGCDGSQPVIESKGVMKVSQERLEVLEERSKQCCQYDAYDPLNTLLKEAVYDDIQASIEWEDICDSSRLPILTKSLTALDLLFLRDWEKIACEQVQSPRRLDVHFIKSVQTDMWDVALARESEGIFAEHVPSNPIIDYMTSVATVANPVENAAHYAQGAVSDKCIVAEDYVRTFDGVAYNYTAAPCWTVAVSDCLKEQFFVYTRQSQSKSHPIEVKIIDRREGVNVEIADNIQVNGVAVEPVQFVERVFDSNGAIIAEVSKQDGQYMIQLPGRPLVAVKETVEIRIGKWYELCGLCGDKTFEPQLELVGPQHCIYQDPQLFATAWTGKGDKCDASSLEQKRVKVQQFQKTCLKVEEVERKRLQEFPYAPFEHEYSYRVIQDQDMLCVSMLPVVSCSQEGSQSPPPVEMACWPKKSAPSLVRDAIRRGIPAIMQPIAGQPQVVRRVALPRVPCNSQSSGRARFA